VLSVTFKPLPRIKEGVIKNVKKKKDKNEHEMAFLTFNTQYGEIKSTIFYRQWSKYKSIIKTGNKYKFINDSKNILQDIKQVE
jgi:DNA polymerase III alpha subunit